MKSSKLKILIVSVATSFAALKIEDASPDKLI